MVLVLAYFVTQVPEQLLAVVLALKVSTQQERELVAAGLAVKWEQEQEPLLPSAPVIAVVVALECHPKFDTT